MPEAPQLPSDALGFDPARPPPSSSQQPGAHHLPPAAPEVPGALPSSLPCFAHPGLFFLLHFSRRKQAHRH